MFILLRLTIFWMILKNSGLLASLPNSEKEAKVGNINPASSRDIKPSLLHFNNDFTYLNRERLFQVPFQISLPFLCIFLLQQSWMHTRAPNRLEKHWRYPCTQAGCGYTQKSFWREPIPLCTSRHSICWANWLILIEIACSRHSVS